MAIDPGVRRIVVGVDGSAESVAALRWACREASLRAAEVHAVLALESACHHVASYAVPTPRQSKGSWGAARNVLRRSVSEAVSLYPGVTVRTEITEGLAARVLLDHAREADMLVLGSTSHGPDPYRGAGPVIRVCLRAAPCPVVIIGSAVAPDPGDHVPESWHRTLEGSAAARLEDRGTPGHRGVSSPSWHRQRSRCGCPGRTGRRRWAACPTAWPPGLLLTPHVGGLSTQALPRARAIAREQLARYAPGEPLRNVVGAQGY